jgi:hypothetical protein
MARARREGIREVRGPRRHFTHSEVMAWVTFDRAVRAIVDFGRSRRRGVPLAREPTIAQRANVIALPRPDRELLGDATHLQLTLVRS